MANDPIDALQIKIENAKAKLPKETIDAIDAVDWKAAIFSLREKKGYTFEQLGDLEIETELLLSGLLSSFDYPKELEQRMGISKSQVDELVKEMNAQVFTRIKAELIKNAERNKVFENKSNSPITREALAGPVESPYKASTLVKNDLATKDVNVLNLHGIKILPTRNTSDTATVIKDTETALVPEKPELSPQAKPHTILSQKLGSSVQNPVKETEHTLENMSPSSAASTAGVGSNSKADPYREIPELREKN